VTSADGLTQTSKTYADAAAYNSDASSGFTSNTWLKKAAITYEKDAGLTYTANLRVIDVRIDDSSGYKRRTAYAYVSVESVRLPADVTEYQGDATTVYRHTQTDYLSYPGYHLYGLPTEVRVYSGSGTTSLAAKTTYAYDEAAYFMTSSGVIQHTDPGYTAGRGNLTTVTQFEVPGSGSRAVGHTKYDSQGVVRGLYDGANHLTTVEVADNYANKPTGVGATNGFATH
jgi:hypothetical protein